MSAVQPKSKVIGMFLSDPHISLHPPIFRSNELDWMEAQKRVWDEINKLHEQLGCPIFCCGDLFDKWNSPPELINWAMGVLPYMHCIPGQHDLPNHSIGQISRSAYNTLKQASVIHDISEKGFIDGNLLVEGYPFGASIEKPIRRNNHIHVAIIHEYNWCSGHGYLNAPSNLNITGHKRRKRFNGYDMVFCGDNHNAFQCVFGKKMQFINCGTIIRRHSDERLFQPCIWLLEENGSVESHHLDITKDRCLSTSEQPHMNEVCEVDFSNFVHELNNLGYDGLDFVSALKQWFAKNKTPKAVQDIVWDSIL